LLFQINYVLSQKLIFKTYTIGDGLIANTVHKIFQDNKGFIWMTTREGLSKYDGYRFINYSFANGLAGNLVNDIYEKANGQLLVAENEGTIDIIEKDSVASKPFAVSVGVNKFCGFKNNKLLAITDTKGLTEINNSGVSSASLVKPLISITEWITVNDSLFLAHTATQEFYLIDANYKIVGSHENTRLTCGPSFYR
jgi:ligand-binding sensor domain-containing protein